MSELEAPGINKRNTRIALHSTKPLIAMVSKATSLVHSFYRINDFCHENCQSDCKFRMTLDNDNCGDCLPGFRPFEGTCLEECQVHEYASLQDGACYPCPACCRDGCNDRLECVGGALIGGYEIKNGVCQLKENREIDTLRIIISRIADLEFEILFESGVQNFNKGKNIEISFKENSISPKEFSYNLTVSNSNSSLYRLSLNITKISYQTTIAIITKDCLNDQREPYPQKQASFSIKRTITSFLGISQSGQEMITAVFTSTANFGDLVSIITSFIFSLILPMNILKFLSLMPIKFPAATLKFFCIFIRFQETDFLSFLVDKLDDDELDSRVFVPTNTYFSFTAVYPRTRLLRFVMRVALSCVFFYKWKKAKKSQNEKNEKKSNFQKFFYWVLVKSATSLLFLYYPIEVLYMGVSLCTNAGPVEQILMLADLAVISLFQFFILEFHRRSKGKDQSDDGFNTLIERELIEGVYIFQNWSDLQTPLAHKLNLTLLIKFLIILSLQNYTRLLSVTMIIFSVFSSIILLRGLKSDKYLSTVNLFKILVGVENLITVMISMMAFVEIKDMGPYDYSVVFLGLTWLTLGLLTTVVQLVEHRIMISKRQASSGKSKRVKVEPVQAHENRLGSSFTINIASMGSTFRKRRTRPGSFKRKLGYSNIGRIGRFANKKGSKMWKSKRLEYGRVFRKGSDIKRGLEDPS